MLPSISWSGGGGGGGASRSAVSPGNGGKLSSSERGRGGGREAQGKLFSSTTEDREETRCHHDVTQFDQGYSAM